MKKVFIVSIFVFFILLPLFASALEYPFGGLEENPHPGAYIRALFIWSLGIVGVMAVTFIAIGGFLYLVGKAEQGKEYIFSSLLGLLLLFGSWLILYTINPDLVDLSGPDLEMPQGNTQNQNSNNTSPQPSGSQSLSINEQEARNTLSGKGINVKNECYLEEIENCVNLEGIQNITLNEIISLAQSAGAANVYVVSGTEGCAAQNISQAERCAGYNVGLQPDPELDSYIQNNFEFLGKRSSDGALQYKAASGTIYTKEEGQWDVFLSDAYSQYATNNQPSEQSQTANPSKLSATAASCSQINLSWTDNSNNETGFKIERKTGVSGSWSQIATVGANITSYSNTGLTGNTTYYYRVRAYNAAGDSSYSNEANATTPACVANQAPVAVATVSKDSATYTDSITVTQGVATPIYLSASGSSDPNGWTDPTNGVSSGGKCEWNRDLNQGAPTFELPVINNPASLSACNISLGNLTFNDAPGIYTYQVLRITDKPGLQSNIDTVSVTVQAPPSQSEVHTPPYFPLKIGNWWLFKNEQYPERQTKIEYILDGDKPALKFSKNHPDTYWGYGADNNLILSAQWCGDVLIADRDCELATTESNADEDNFDGKMYLSDFSDWTYVFSYNDTDKASPWGYMWFPKYVNLDTIYETPVDYYKWDKKWQLDHLAGGKMTYSYQISNSGLTSILSEKINEDWARGMVYEDWYFEYGKGPVKIENWLGAARTTLQTRIILIDYYVQ